LSLLGVALSLLATPPGPAASFRAELDPAVVTVGEAASLSLIFEGGVPDVLPPLPGVPNLIFAPAGREDRISIINGRQTATTTFRYLVTAAAPGTHTVPALTVTVDGQQLTSQPLQLTAQPAGQGGAPAAAGGAQLRRALLSISVPRTNVFVGEVLPVDLLLYAINPRRFELGQLPADGFTLGKQAQIEPARVPMNGVFYTRTGTRTTVTPNRVGDLKLGPLNGRVEVLVPVARRRGDLFDDFFNDPFFNRASEVAVADVVAEAVAITVWPLPASNRPPAFTGAVGEFKLEATAGPTNVAVGEPVRLRVQISGRGALAALTLPSLDGWSDFRVYPAVSRVETTDTLGIEGAKVIEHDLIPQNAEVKAVPPLVFSFFDPVNRAYVSLTNPPIPLLVRPVGSRGPPLVVADTAPPPREIVHLKPRLGAVAVIGPPWVTRPGFFIALLTPAVLWLAVLSWRKRREHLEANPRLVRRRAVARQVRAGGDELARLATAGDAVRFFALTFRLLQEQLGERLDLPAASITEAIVDERLRPRGVDGALLDEVRALFQACNQVRYAPAGAGENLPATAERVRRVLEKVRTLDLG
jgi:hypothetical protein